MIFIRALWGNPDVVTYNKALWDVTDRSCRLPPDADLRIVAYGERNREFLASKGYGDNVLCVPDEVPPEYDMINPDRDHAIQSQRGRHGTIQDGVMMWWHKIQSIRHVLLLEPKAQVIWIDWDTKILRTPDAKMWDELSDGPDFQGCQTTWKHPPSKWREGRKKKWAFHGGCYYIRGLSVIQQVLAAHARDPLESDETAFTWVADEMYGFFPNGQHKCDNLGFYRCRKTTEHSNSYFAEGDVIKYWEAPKVHV